MVRPGLPNYMVLYGDCKGIELLIIPILRLAYCFRVRFGLSHAATSQKAQIFRDSRSNHPLIRVRTSRIAGGLQPPTVLNMCKRA